MNLDIVYLLISFCGGAFGAAIGALPAFIFCGFIGLAGVAAGMAGSDFNWHGLITFGPYLGPHISFAAGAAAAAFARKMGYIESGKDITAALMGIKKPSVLVVGGIFGVLAYIIQTGAASIFKKGEFDTIAFTVVAVPLIAKVIFGDGFFGKLSDEAKARGRFVLGGSNRWLAFQESMGEKAIIGLAAGGVSAFITQAMLANPSTASQALFVGFLVSAASLIFLQFGTTVPVTHHITLCAAYAVAASGGDILWGIAMAVVASNLADLGARLFYIHGDTHIDPPAFAIFTGSILIYLLKIAGVYSVGGAAIPIIVIALFVIWSLYDSKKTVNSPTGAASVTP